MNIVQNDRIRTYQFELSDDELNDSRRIQMKNILNFGKQIIIFTACAVVFTAAVFSALFREGTPSPDVFLSENAVCVDIFLDKPEVEERVTYSELYSLFEAHPQLTVIKPYRGRYLIGIQIYSTDPDFSLARYVKNNDIFNMHDSLLFMEQSALSFAVTGSNGDSFLMLNGTEHNVEGTYSSNNVYDYAFVSNLYSFCENNNFVNNETLFIDCGEETYSFAKELSRLFTQKNEDYIISLKTGIETSSSGEMTAENIIIFVSVIFMIIIICFGVAVYVRIMIGKRMKEIFCKFLCGAELSVIRREFLREFALIALTGSVAGAVISILLYLFASDFVTVAIPCVAAAAAVIPALIFLICLYVQKSSFPAENDLQRRTRQ